MFQRNQIEFLIRIRKQFDQFRSQNAKRRRLKDEIEDDDDENLCDEYNRRVHHEIIFLNQTSTTLFLREKFASQNLLENDEILHVILDRVRFVQRFTRLNDNILYHYRLVILMSL